MSTQHAFELPEAVRYSAAHITTRTHKLPDGRFAAVGAIYFLGRRGLYVSAVGATRRQAERSVKKILDPDPHAADRSERCMREMEYGFSI
ncbi:MAG: hypothetical protein ACYC9P_07900 [Rudaea sp.]